MAMKFDPVCLLTRMLEVYSPSGKEEKLAVFLRDEMTNLGFDNVRLDDVGNVYGEVGSGSLSVLLCGHMDTVPGWMPVRIKDGKLFGRGSVDAKSSLAAMISAAYELGIEDTIKGKVVIAGVVEEEQNAKGIHRLLRNGIKTDYAVFGEPSGVDNITFAYKGRLATRIRCRVETGHIGAQHYYGNAIERAYELWEMIRNVFEGKRSPHGIFYSVTPCLTDIRSRRNSGSIPDECTLTMDMRLPPPVGSVEGISLIKNIIEEYRRKNPDVSVNLAVTDRVEPFVADRNTVLMNALREAIEEESRKPPKFIRKTGTGDMNIFGAETGIPVATYGPGDAHLSHTKEEYVELEEYKTSIKVYKKTVEKLLLSTES